MYEGFKVPEEGIEMRLRKRIVLVPLLLAMAGWIREASAFYHPQTGRWLSRDPASEKGGINLHNFVRNNPVSLFDRLGLAVSYSIVNLEPTGWWGLSLANVDVPGGMTWKGFHSRYLPTDGRNEHPPCPCKKEDIILVQVVSEPWHGGRLQFDVGKPGYLPPHAPNDPIPSYYWDTRPADPFTIVDAPNSSGSAGTWEFEDCAVCRTRPDANSITDRVLGCVKFKFHRISDGKAEISVEGGRFGSGGFSNAKAPGALWNNALEDWRKRGR